ncbi:MULTISPECIES: hypothetical protein [unclassified Streptomyces]|uniref:hypothetical protein n=1 Tax=unclassified Streptomyces TaxID=2593676 RepID=UPI00344E4D40
MARQLNRRRPGTVDAPQPGAAQAAGGYDAFTTGLHRAFTTCAVAVALSALAVFFLLGRARPVPNAAAGG